MAWGKSHEFPRAILHVDGDGFFAGCEVAKNPRLRGKPVITGKERGIVSACTYEAKARGVKRGMQLHEVRRICPEAVILPSDYETYSLFSERMYGIVRRFTPSVEEYGIDECFADLTGLRRMHRASYPDIAERVKHDLELELGMTFSLGLSATKVLAKIGSKWNKPSGLTVIPLSEAAVFLAKTPTEKVWGIGANTAAYLAKFGVRTALDLARKGEAWVRGKLSKPYVELWYELNGEVMNELDTEGRAGYRSISKTKTFTPPSRDKAFVFSQLSKNIENACIKARRWGLAAPEGAFFLKTQEFKYHGRELRFPHPTNVPQDVLAAVRREFDSVYRAGVPYRATGITLAKLSSDASVQLDIFGSVSKAQGLKNVFDSVDALSERYGKHAVFLGSSFRAMREGAHTGARGESAARARALFKGETARRHLGVPFLGEV
ncbi:DNA polymerase IV [Candidatus Kaiserbacteria bacterium CG10_big_fil_rev_8_21_14_0_10_59_10]|uniref:DNA polymerase IV n=1 Tax=Candidatus Kaiserbacteria bacterium CG10_big_fil_rev_8_21_14_0_10_59_10 TaxID=1974612 RepID=A0A2H0U7W1_9BACT|nr:MAG: DNA polymerase IV [Candidatus Kaiserbacteria bacterium CG10_big_fil_rev_8_21_14_0_10_59_10]